jgi:uncharacterized protein (TIGR03435 family)
MLGTVSGNQITGPRVVDKTGLSGKYDFTLRFAGSMRAGGAFPNPAVSDPSDEPAPDIFAALEMQLGLKLEKRKVTIDMLVVDRADKTPAEN